MEYSIENGWVVVSLQEKLTLNQAIEIRQLFQQKTAEGETRFKLDASQVAYVDSFAIGLLLELSRIQGREKGEIRIMGLKGEPLNIIHKNGLEFLLQDGSETG